MRTPFFAKEGINNPICHTVDRRAQFVPFSPPILSAWTLAQTLPQSRTPTPPSRRGAPAGIREGFGEGGGGSDDVSVMAVALRRCPPA